MVLVGVAAAFAHTFTVTVLELETYPYQIRSFPGYVTGVADTAISVVAPATVAVPVAHAPTSNRLPPIAAVLPDSGMDGAKKPA
jgi:hypothetical protein